MEQHNLNQHMAKVAEAREWYSETLVAKVVESLEKNNITGFYVKTREEALKKVLDLIPEGSTVGFGGSLTLDQIGIKDRLVEGNYNFIDRRQPGLSADQLSKMQKESLLADVFLSSTNAITMDGKLVNVDGVGNRVAALIFGPTKVIIVAGANKIVPNVEAALQKIRNYIAPLHARHRDWPLPCAKTGECSDCRAPQRICNTTCIIENQRQKDRITVIIVGEELGL